jgi:uncharacterized protein (DUF736 family)
MTAIGYVRKENDDRYKGHLRAVSLSIAAPEFGPKKLYANLGRAAGSDEENLYAVIWNPGD